MTSNSGYSFTKIGSAENTTQNSKDEQNVPNDMRANAKINRVEHVWHYAIQPQANGMPQQCWNMETIRKQVRAIRLICPYGVPPRSVYAAICVQKIWYSCAGAAHEAHAVTPVPAREPKATAIKFPIPAHLA